MTIERYNAGSTRVSWLPEQFVVLHEVRRSELMDGSVHAAVLADQAQAKLASAGVRPGGERVYVEGMGSGTREQLYLALRLASLEKYMESSEPIPFIVDDILVDFDDGRSQAALSALADKDCN